MRSRGQSSSSSMMLDGVGQMTDGNFDSRDRRRTRIKPRCSNTRGFFLSAVTLPSNSQLPLRCGSHLPLLPFHLPLWLIIKLRGRGRASSALSYRSSAAGSHDFMRRCGAGWAMLECRGVGWWRTRPDSGFFHLLELKEW